VNEGIEAVLLLQAVHAWRARGPNLLARDTDDTKWPRRDIARKHKLRTFISRANDVAARSIHSIQATELDETKACTG
jgi:hypothetical protein